MRRTVCFATIFAQPYGWTTIWSASPTRGSVSGKLYATTASVAKANERVMDLHGKLIESQYKTEVLDVTLDTRGYRRGSHNEGIPEEKLAKG